MDSLILAEASLARLGEHVNYFVIDPTELAPEANQGAIAVVGRSNWSGAEEIKTVLDDESWTEVKAEREVLRIVGGGCSFPVGVLFRVEGNSLWGVATYITPYLKVSVQGTFRADPTYAGRELGRKLLEAMRSEGALAEA